MSIISNRLGEIWFLAPPPRTNSYSRFPGTSADLSYTDRECGTDLTNLWLDAVAVVDNSIGMTNEGLANIAANICTVFSGGTRIGTQASEPQTTRVGLVTYNVNAQQNADLNKFQSLDDLYNNVFADLSSVSTSAQSFLSTGLAAAESLFDYEIFGINRSHYKKVVIVYASSYAAGGEMDPLPVANRLKSSDVRIITVAYDQTGDGLLLKQLAEIASPRFNFSNTDNDGNTIGQVQSAMLETNCFCPSGWIQYRQNYTDYNSYRYGVCLQAVNLAAGWRAAKMSCANRWTNSYLVNEYNQQKHDYVLNVVQNSSGFFQPYSYHNGLNLVGGVWKWDQPSGWPQPALKYWYNWDPGYPITSSSLTAVLNQQNNEEVATGWQNIDYHKTAVNYVSCSAKSYVDRPCGTDLSNLWLDVVLVVDNSQGMNTDRLHTVTANILSVFGSGTRIGIDETYHRTTRLGLVTYNSNATQNADLYLYQSFDEASDGIIDATRTAVDTSESYLATGLILAEKLFNEQSVNNVRSHYKRVVIVYASEYEGDGELDPLPVANRLKLSGVNIITAAYEQSGDDGLFESLSQIATPAFSFSFDYGLDGNFVGNIQGSLLQSNCFCPSDWIQYRESYSDPASSRYGVCIQAVTIPASWVAAKLSCSNKRTNSNLATEFNQAKHDFIFNLAQNTTGFSPPYQYHIGLNYVSSGSWVWTQPTGHQQVPLQQPFMWLPGYPKPASTQSAVMNVQSGQETGWQNIATMTGSYNYFCETYACDTDNYCAAEQ
ncbi:hypothetical protein GCK72_003267 [Caenorhabditis remanei]|uniref:VWFA domain-containing protein n=1 Tax=Caenorhabditis remanei TaxID=31234 RepID=A0A6A5HW27_CAERE|nr:hypothetical protein GCK72_003267 [Caenorhabditis remanei]KAF1771441.1 hypothetical protein GCK72_003267 [Caenorhabditis remanei]